jgi:hypothetical protein
VPGVSFSRFAAFVGMTALVILASCGDDGGSGDDTSSRDSDVYAAIVRSVAADQPHEEDETPIVYLTPFPNEKPIPLDVQVGVVDAVADNATVRFVDEEDQAIDKGAEGEPVVDDGVLVRIGTVPEEGTTVTVPAELYHSDNDIVPTEYQVTEGTDSWTATEKSTASG